MKYVSLDIETTCLEPMVPENILMLSMAVEDTEHPEIPVVMLPHFTCYFLNPDDKYTGSAYGITMNSWIFDILSGRTKADYQVYDMNGYDFRRNIIKFLHDNFGMEIITLAGKNVASFDYQFLPSWLQGFFKYRMIDPGSVFIDFKDTELKSLGELKKELKIEGDVTHDARGDAMDVIKILRKKLC